MGKNNKNGLQPTIDENKENSVDSSKTEICKLPKDDENSNESSASVKTTTSTQSTNVSPSSTSKSTELKENSKKAKENEDEPAKDTTEYCVASSNPKEFKLRIVSLEKLLDPKIAAANTSKKDRNEIVDNVSKKSSQNKTKEDKKSLPKRTTRKSNSIIDIDSESEEEEEEEESESETSTPSDRSRAASKSRSRTNKTHSKDNTNSKKNKTVLSVNSTSESESVSSKKDKDRKGKQEEKVRQLPKRIARTTTKCAIVDISDEEEDDEEDEEEVEKVRANDKSANSKESRQTNNKNSKQIKSKPKGPRPPPPSAASVKRCLVKLKRCKLSDFKNLNSRKKQKQMTEKPTSSNRAKRGESDDDSDFDMKSSDAKDEDDDENVANSTDSEIIPQRKKRVFQKGKKESNNSDSDFEPDSSKQKKKRKRIQRGSSDDSGTSDDEKNKTKRKEIRKIIKTDNLNVSTKAAGKEEEERRKRIEERQKLYNKIYEKPESVEVSELVLDFDEETKEHLLEVDKGLMKKLKPHQVNGVKFMWEACFETINDAQEKSGSGCILAHCMGLGKTMQIVTLSHTLLANSRKTGVERVLIISPLSTLTNWAREFKHWMGFARKRNIEIYDISKYKDKSTRIFKLNEWFEEGGVCIMGYDMYRILSNEKAKGLRKKQRDHLLQSLVDPGPDMVVCDEGHLLKNEKTSISRAVTRMRTKRRIVLTGTPLQNNLKEYYCMIQFIKPNLLGTYKEYLNRFVNPITNGQYTDSTERDIRLMKHRSHILHQLLGGCIQRRDYSVLAPYLPPKHEYVVYTTLSIVQQLIYEHYMTHQREIMNSSEVKGARLFQDFQELRRIWTHPMNMRINSDTVIRKKVLEDDNNSIDDFICDDENDDDEGAGSVSDSSGNSSKSYSSNAPQKVQKTRNFRRNANASGIDIDSDIEEMQQTPSQDDPSEWWKRFVSDKELNNIHHSPKLVILMKLLQQCEAIGDKLLVFSQSLQSLDTIEHFLALVDSKTRAYEYEGDVGEFSGFWTPGTDYFRLDGSCSVEQRESMCKKFNDASNLRSRLFLISTRAGGLGINLVAANRVVIFDVSWNPSHDTQSIFRVYRFGQTKPCYIYRLIAMGTMEQKLYERQVAKQATAKRVIDEQQISRHYNQSDLLELYTYELTPSTEREIPILPKDRLFAELLTEHEKLIFKYHEHDSLLENEVSENLSEEERRAAWSDYEAEKTRTIQTAQYMANGGRPVMATGYNYGNSSGSVTSNKMFGFRSDVLLQLLNFKISKDHPEMNSNQVLQAVPTYLNELYAQMNNGDPTMYKDLLILQSSLAYPSGTYMNPLLYANQNPIQQQQMNGRPAQPMMMNQQMMNQPVGMVPNPAVLGVVPNPAAGFDPNQVYEID